MNSYNFFSNKNKISELEVENDNVARGCYDATIMLLRPKIGVDSKKCEILIF